MILIVSESYDNSTTDVIKWLSHYKTPFIRMNSEDKFFLEKVLINNSDEIEVLLRRDSDNLIINLSHVTFFWYRRGSIYLAYNIDHIPICDIYDDLVYHLKKEKLILREFVDHFLLKKPNSGSLFSYKLNKLLVLSEAKRNGLLIPDTIIVDRPSNYVKNQEGEMITKSIGDILSVKYEGLEYMTYTEKVNKSELSDLSFPSLFQKQILKEADIRVFYFLGEMFSMAIMSQSRKKSEVDFRKYSILNPNRSFPFNLPAEIKGKLTLLMNNLKLKTGSIDMVLDTKGCFYFLEINPVGQFGMTSVPCNYYCERFIAKNLTEEYERA